MTPADLYLLATINRHRAPNNDTPNRLHRQLSPFLHHWPYATHLEKVTISGSHAKNTALRDSDLDLFLSLSPTTPGPLAAIHASIQDQFQSCLPLTRNVSIRIMFNGHAIDLIPARRRPNSTAHTL